MKLSPFSHIKIKFLVLSFSAIWASLHFQHAPMRLGCPSTCHRSTGFPSLEHFCRYYQLGTPNTPTVLEITLRVL